MWREIGKLIAKIACIILPVVLIMQIFCALFPMYYMDGEYAMYRQQKDYISSENDYNRILIIGDSRAKASFVPDILGEGVYNLALGGITPIESYYMLEEYLEKHDAPQYLILAYAPMHLCAQDEEHENYVLWNRCIYFHTFDQDDFFTLIKERKQYQNNLIVDRDYIYAEYFMYKYYFPNKYGAALKKALFENRHKLNQDKYDEMITNRGYSLFGTAGVNGGVNGEAHFDDFSACDFTDDYLNRVFDLCRENNIRVILEQLPMTETSYRIINANFFLHYEEYLKNVASNNPDVIINPNVEMYNDTLFGDIDHLNTEGSTMYSNIIKERYAFAFME